MRINIKFKPGVDSHLDWGQVSAALEGFSIKAQTPPLRLFTVEIADESAETALAHFRALDCVERALIDAEVHADYIGREEIPFLARVPNQWGLPRMNAYEVHKFQRGDPSVVVAVIDTGLLEAHEEFTGRGLQGDSVDPTGNPWNLPGHNHGTRCASCISPNHEAGEVAALAPNVTVFPVRASEGAASSFSTANLVTAVSIAVGYGADFISFSIGGSESIPDLDDAFDYAIAEGVLIIKSAGNNGESGGEPSTPVREDCITVGAINVEDKVSTFSSFGPVVDIVAPGEAIVTPDIVSNYSYSEASGTSFSTPYVAAICALVKSENPALTNQEIWDIVCGEVTPVTDPEFDAKFTKPGGIGCANALKAVLKARSMREGNATFSYPFIRFYGDNIDLVFRQVDESTGTTGYLEYSLIDETLPVDAELGVYGAKKVSEAFQGENFVFRGPKFVHTNTMLSGPYGVITTTHPSGVNTTEEEE